MISSEQNGERIAKLEQAISELAPMRTRVHETAQHVMLLNDCSERMEEEQKAIRSDIAVLRAEGQLREERILARLTELISAHDKRDDDRFNASGSRLNTIEDRIRVFDYAAQAQENLLEHREARRNKIFTALVAVCAALCGALLPLVYNHIFSGGH